MAALRRFDSLYQDEIVDVDRFPYDPPSGGNNGGVVIPAPTSEGVNAGVGVSVDVSKDIVGVGGGEADVLVDDVATDPYTAQRNRRTRSPFMGKARPQSGLRI